MAGGYPPSSGQPGPAGYPGPGGFAGPTAAGVGSGWHGDQGRGAPPGWQQATPDSGYPDYGYPPADGYRPSVNGGDYAYVITDSGPRRPSSPGPADPRGPQPGPAQEPRRRTREERIQARRSGEIRSITTGMPAAPPAPSPAAPTPVAVPTNTAPTNTGRQSGAYGPDDPGYGPPAPGWSHQDRPAAAEPPAPAEPGQPPATADRLATARTTAQQPTADHPTADHPTADHPDADRSPDPDPGPNKPATDPITPKRPGQEQAESDHAPADPGQPAATLDPAEAQPTVRGPFEPITDHVGHKSGTADAPETDADGRPYDFPGLDDDEPAGSATAALDRLKELHRTAASVAPQSLDAHFDQLLERQRRLISEYISASEASSAPAGDADDSLVGFGGDIRGTR